jgi:hypothetical protein
MTPRRHRRDATTVARHGDGGFTQTLYFTSEAEARRNEATSLPPELQQARDRFAETVGELRYLDLRDRWLAAPGR